MNHPYIDINKCTGCGECVRSCPQECISIVNGKAVLEIQDCVGCSVCATVCPEKAIAMIVETQMVAHEKQSQDELVTVAPKSTSTISTSSTIGKIAKFLFRSSVAVLSSPSVIRFILGRGTGQVSRSQKVERGNQGRRLRKRGRK